MRVEPDFCSPQLPTNYSCEGINSSKGFADIAAMDIRKLFGGNVARLRKERGFTQERFCEMVGIKQSYLSRIENGQVNLSLLGIHDIAQALKVSPDALFISLAD